MMNVIAMRRREVQGTYSVTPHIVERWNVADVVEMGSVAVPEDGESALIVFTSRKAAERFRAETGKFPASEGFEVVYVDADGLKNLIRTWGYSSLAVVGLEPGGGAGFFNAEGFCDLLEEVA